MADKRRHERKWEVNGWPFFHERQLPSIAVRFKSNVRLNSLDDAVTAPRDSFGDEHPNHSPGGVVGSVPTISGSDGGDWDLGDMPFGLASGFEKRGIVLSTCSLVSRAGFPDADSCLDVFCLLENGWRDRLTLMELRRVLTNKRAEAESSVPEALRLKERVCVAEEDSEAHCVVHVRVDELKAELASLTAGTEQEKAECDILATCIRELEVAATTRDGEVGFLVRPVQSLEGLVVSGKDRANTAEGRAHEKLDKYSNFGQLSKG